MEDDVSASTSYPARCGTLQQGGFVTIKDRPCKIMDKCIQTTGGKNGQAKIHLVGIDIFTSNKLEAYHPSNHSVDVPNIQRKQYKVLSIDDDGFLSLLCVEDCSTRRDLKVSRGNLYTEIEETCRTEKDDIYVQVLTVMGVDVVEDLEANYLDSAPVPASDKALA